MVSVRALLLSWAQVSALAVPETTAPPINRAQGYQAAFWPRERDDGDGGHHDDAVDDQRPRPRLTRPDARTGREISQSGEGQLERPRSR